MEANIAFEYLKAETMSGSNFPSTLAEPVRKLWYLLKQKDYHKDLNL